MNYKEIKSYEDACKVLGVQPISENAVAAFPAEDRKSMLAYHKLTIITRAINGGLEAGLGQYQPIQVLPYILLRKCRALVCGYV